eukprot:Rmarinus@m.10461
MEANGGPRWFVDVEVLESNFPKYAKHVGVSVSYRGMTRSLGCRNVNSDFDFMGRASFPDWSVFHNVRRQSVYVNALISHHRTGPDHVSDCCFPSTTDEDALGRDLDVVDVVATEVLPLWTVIAPNAPKIMDCDITCYRVDKSRDPQMSDADARGDPKKHTHGVDEGGLGTACLDARDAFVGSAQRRLHWEYGEARLTVRLTVRWNREKDTPEAADPVLGGTVYVMERKIKEQWQYRDEVYSDWLQLSIALRTCANRAMWRRRHYRRITRLTVSLIVGKAEALDSDLRTDAMFHIMSSLDSDDRHYFQLRTLSPSLVIRQTICSDPIAMYYLAHVRPFYQEAMARGQPRRKGVSSENLPETRRYNLGTALGLDEDVIELHGESEFPLPDVFRVVELESAFDFTSQPQQTHAQSLNWGQLGAALDGPGGLGCRDAITRGVADGGAAMSRLAFEDRFDAQVWDMLTGNLEAVDTAAPSDLERSGGFEMWDRGQSERHVTAGGVFHSGATVLPKERGVADNPGEVPGVLGGSFERWDRHQRSRHVPSMPPPTISKQAMEAWERERDWDAGPNNGHFEHWDRLTKKRHYGAHPDSTATRINPNHMWANREGNQLLDEAGHDFSRHAKVERRSGNGRFVSPHEAPATKAHPPSDGALVRRTLAADSFVVLATAGIEPPQRCKRRFRVKQVVILGGGLDTRAFRLQLPRGVVIFDVGSAIAADVKRKVLTSWPEPNVKYKSVSWNLQPCTLLPCLTDVGFDAGAPAAWVFEGLLPHLSAPHARSLLETVGQLAAPGSLLLADVMSSTGTRVPSMAGTQGLRGGSVAVGMGGTGTGAIGRIAGSTVDPAEDLSDAMSPNLHTQPKCWANIMSAPEHPHAWLVDTPWHVIDMSLCREGRDWADYAYSDGTTLVSRKPPRSRRAENFRFTPEFLCDLDPSLSFQKLSVAVRDPVGLGMSTQPWMALITAVKEVPHVSKQVRPKHADAAAPLYKNPKYIPSKSELMSTQRSERQLADLRDRETSYNQLRRSKQTAKVAAQVDQQTSSSNTSKRKGAAPKNKKSAARKNTTQFAGQGSDESSTSSDTRTLRRKRQEAWKRDIVSNCMTFGGFDRSSF